ncbi:MAG: hypothetical protein IPG50_32740 [Myxococcales bacterium]|nr:hypothetical protein [Myxococcales bacterium]
MSSRHTVVFVLFAAVVVAGAAVGCRATEESFCASYKLSYVKRCTESCMQVQVSKSAPQACEAQCTQSLPLDTTWAASCGSARALPGAAPPPSASTK